MSKFILGFIIYILGTFTGITMMCLLQINRHKEILKDSEEEK